MKLANFVTKLQDVLRPTKGEADHYNSPTQQGRRINVPSGEVERIYKSHHKKRVRIEYDGPTKTICVGCGVPFLYEPTGRGRHPDYHTNACKQKAYRERNKTT